jgi:hypothetical protein
MLHWLYGNLASFESYLRLQAKILMLLVVKVKISEVEHRLRDETKILL